MKDRAITFTKMARTRNYEFIEMYKKNHPCVDCGNSDIRVLDFDHIGNNKLTEVSKMAKDIWSLDRIKREINKCQIRCSNCHRIKTWERRQIKFAGE